jgi:hypothetical protein
MWIIPKTLQRSSGFSATAGIISDLNELSRVCASSLLARSRPMRARTWLQKWNRDSWMPLLSGRIAAHSHAKCFEDWWTCSLLRIRARDSVRRVNAKDKAILASYGLGLSGQLSLFNLAGFSSKTSTDTSRLDSLQSSQIWRRQVMAQSGEYSRRLKLELHNRANGSSFSLTTPSLDEPGEVWPTATAASGTFNKSGDKTRLQLARAVNQNWPTVRASEAQKQPSDQNRQSPCLTHVVKTAWHTPRSNDAEKRGEIDATNPRNGLVGQVKGWATPQVFDATGIVRTEEKLAETRSRPSKATCINLREQVHWPTPNLPERGVCEAGMNRRSPDLQNLVAHSTGLISSAGQTNHKSRLSRPESPKLSADWVEALMDVPPMWTDCDYLGMASIPQPQPEHIKS